MNTHSGVRWRGVARREWDAGYRCRLGRYCRELGWPLCAETRENTPCGTRASGAKMKSPMPMGICIALFPIFFRRAEKTSCQLQVNLSLKKALKKKPGGCTITLYYSTWCLSNSGTTNSPSSCNTSPAGLLPYFKLKATWLTPTSCNSLRCAMSAFRPNLYPKWMGVAGVSGSWVRSMYRDWEKGFHTFVAFRHSLTTAPCFCAGWG